MAPRSTALAGAQLAARQLNCGSVSAALAYQIRNGELVKAVKTIRAMADGTLDSQVGARICNGLGIMRACLETQKLEQLESRMDEIADRVARDRTNAAHKEIHP